MVYESYVSSTISWKPWWWVRFDLIFTMRDIHQLQPGPTHEIQCQQQKDWVLKISTHKTSPNHQEDHPNQLNNSNNLCLEKGYPFWVWRKEYGIWENTLIRISQWREATVEQMLPSEERKKSKWAGLWELQ